MYRNVFKRCVCVWGEMEKEQSDKKKLPRGKRGGGVVFVEVLKYLKVERVRKTIFITKENEKHFQYTTIT